MFVYTSKVSFNHENMLPYLSLTSSYLLKLNRLKASHGDASSSMCPFSQLMITLVLAGSTLVYYLMYWAGAHSEVSPTSVCAIDECTYQQHSPLRGRRLFAYRSFRTPRGGVRFRCNSLFAFRKGGYVAPRRLFSLHTHLCLLLLTPSSLLKAFCWISILKHFAKKNDL